METKGHLKRSNVELVKSCKWCSTGLCLGQVVYNFADDVKMFRSIPYSSSYSFQYMEDNFSNLCIKTHDSESRGQEAAITCKIKITRPLSELFTRKTANKITNTLAKLP